MFKLIKNKIEAFLVDKIENDYTSLNKNPFLMYKLCESHPELAKNAEGKAASLHLFKMVISKAQDKEKAIDDLLWEGYSFTTNPECIKYAIEVSGNFIKYAKGKGFTLENFLLAINHPDKSKRFDADKYFEEQSFDLWETSKSEIKRLLEYDGRFLGSIDEDKITPELIRIAFNNPDKSKRPDLSKLSNIRTSEKNIKELIKIDPIYYVYSLCEDEKGELLKLALSQNNPEKTLTYDRLPENYPYRLPYSNLKELIKIDKKWIKIAQVGTIPKDILISALKDEELNIVPDINDLSYFDDDVLNVLLENARSGRYEISDIEKMLRSTLNSKFINSNFFKVMTKGLCDKLGVDIDFFNYHINRALRINDEFLNTIKLEFLGPRFHKLYEKNGYEKLYVLAMYPDIQNFIISIANPKKEDGTIDIELGNKKIELLAKMLEKSIIGKDNKEHKEWTSYYNRVLHSFYENPKLYDYMAEHMNELDDKMLERLVTHSLGRHMFEIKSIDDLKNYEQIRNNWIEECMKSDSPQVVKDGVLEKIFGISYETAKSLYKSYIVGIKKSPELFPKDIVDFYMTLDIIFTEENLDILKTVAKNIKRKEDLTEIDFVHFKTILRSIYVEKFNETLYTTEGKKEDEIYAGVKMYKAGGENGDKPFNISLHSLGAYLNDLNPTGSEFSFKESWNRPKMSYHGICTSYVANNNMGIAPVKFTILGFTDYEEAGLLLAGPDDIYSDNQSFSTIEVEDTKSTHLMPKDLINMTRHTHNEMVFERRIGMDKRQPSYIVLACDDYEKLKKEYESEVKKGRYKIKDGECLEGEKESDLMYYALKAANDFGIPIVIIEREKIAKHEHQVIQSRLDSFIKDEKLNREEIQEYFYDLITNLENNHAGNRDWHDKIDKKYFNSSLAGMITKEIKDKINKYMKEDPQLALIMIEELEKVIQHEEECTRSYGIYDIEGLKSYCEKQREKLTDMIKNHDSILDDIREDSHLAEFNQVFAGKLEEQISISQICSSIDLNYLNIAYNSVEELYPKAQQDEIKSVMLFSMMIGKTENLSNADLDVLLTATLYKDLDLSTLDNSAKEDTDFIKAVIELHKSGLEESTLEEICNKYNIAINDTKKVERLRTITTCLCDACELDKAKCNQNDPNYINPNNLYRESSKKMVKVALQISERKAEKEVESLCYNKPELYDSIVEALQKHNNPKQVIELYKQEKINISEEEYNYGQSTTKK